MEFLITRASLSSRDARPPHPDAELKERDVYGKNIWTIKIGTMKALAEFVRGLDGFGNSTKRGYKSESFKTPEIVLGFDPPSIHIYDDWLE